MDVILIMGAANFFVLLIIFLVLLTVLSRNGKPKPSSLDAIKSAEDIKKIKKSVTDESFEEKAF